MLPMVRAAKAQRAEVIWDLRHYGWPDDIDIFMAEFVERFAAYAAAATWLLRDEGVEALLIAPLNEISFWARAGGAWPTSTQPWQACLHGYYGGELLSA